MNSKAKAKSVEELADEIFSRVQESQGSAFISDGLGALKTREELFSVVKASYWHTLRSAQVIAGFLKDYGELPGKQVRRPSRGGRGTK